MCSTFVIDMQQKLEPNPGDRSAEYLQAILQTLQNPGTSARDGTTPPAWPGPSFTDVTVSILLYTSLSTSLLAAFLAMLGKQWVNRYARHQGGSIAERCEDRQRKLNGFRRWPFRIVIESLPMLLQFSLLLLGAALALFLWDVNRMAASVVAGFTAYGLSFYTCIAIAGMFSYECPFQTPLSLTLRHFGVNRLVEKLFSGFFPKSMEPNPGADCVSWTLNRITDPEVTMAALKYLTTIRWDRSPPEKAPLLQVARIYAKCFDASYRVLSESREIAYAAGLALIQLYFHRVCSNVGVDDMPQVVTDAFYHLCNGEHSGNLRPASLVARSIQNTDKNFGCRWDLSRFDLQWVSEMWMHYARICRSRIKEGQSWSVIEERNIPADLSAFFEKEGTPPPSVARNILRGLLVCISSSVPPFEDPFDHERYFTPSHPQITIGAHVFARADSDSRLFQHLRCEMMHLTGDKLSVLRDVLKPLLFWRHERAEVVTLCCHLLKAVVKRHDAEVALTRDVVHLLCQIAFRNLPPTVELNIPPLDLETLDHLIPLVKNGPERFLDDLLPALSSFSWGEKQQQTIIWMILNAPVASFSPSCLSAAVTVIGRARLSVVEMVDRNRMLMLVERLSVETLVGRMIADASVRAGWMGLLLSYTCPRTPPDIRSHRSLWRILLALVHERPQFFPRELWNHLTEALLEGLDTGETMEVTEKRQVLWMKLLWSSRFFESDCKSWADFEIATTELVRQTPSLLPGLLELCAALEKSEAHPSLAYSKIRKIPESVAQDTLFILRPSPVFTKPLSNVTPHGKPPPRSKLEVGGAGEVSELGNPSQKLPQVAPKDTPPSRRPALRNPRPQPQRIAPQDTPPVRPEEPPRPQPQDAPPFHPEEGRRHPGSPLRGNTPPIPPGGETVEVPLEDGTPSLLFWMGWHDRGYFD